MKRKLSNRVTPVKNSKTKEKNEQLALERATLDIAKAMRVLNIITAAGDIMHELEVDKEKTLEFFRTER